ncbi:MAG: hypothetical protein AAGB51_10470 [Planctomycetota bacterium]
MPIGLLALATFQGPQEAEDSFFDWLDGARDEIAAGVEIPGVEFVYTVIRPPTLSARELQWMRERVENRPDDPELAVLRREEMRHRDGAEISERRFWYVSPRKWRLSADLTNNQYGIGRFDYGSDGEWWWELAEDFVARNSQELESGDRFASEEWGRVFTERVYGWLSQTDLPIREVEFDVVSDEDFERVHVTYTPRPGVEINEGFVFDPDYGTWRPEWVEFTRFPDGGDREGARRLFSDAEWDQVLGRNIARVVQEVHAAGQIVEETVYLDAKEHPASEIASLSSAPRAGSIDPLRGEIVVESDIAITPAGRRERSFDRVGQLISDISLAEDGRPRSGYMAALQTVAIVVLVGSGAYALWTRFRKGSP